MFRLRWSGHKPGQRACRIFSPECKAEAVASYYKNGLGKTCARFYYQKLTALLIVSIILGSILPLGLCTVGLGS